MRSMILLVAVLAAGCATTTYYHPTKTRADYERDSYDCEQDAYQRTADKGFAGNPLIASGEYDKCMRHKYGYTTSPQ